MIIVGLLPFHFISQQTFDMGIIIIRIRFSPLQPGSTLHYLRFTPARWGWCGFSKPAGFVSYFADGKLKWDLPPLRSVKFPGQKTDDAKNHKAIPILSCFSRSIAHRLGSGCQGSNCLREVSTVHLDKWPACVNNIT